MGKLSKRTIGKIVISLLAVILFVLIMVWIFSDDDSRCSLSTLTQPTNGSWGATCSSNSGEIQHGTSCDLSCNTGYTPSNQPTCNNGELSSTTLTCTAGVSSGSTSSGSTNSGSTNSGSTSGDCTTPDPVPRGYDISNVTGSPSKDSFSITGVRCATGYTGTEPSAIVCGTVGGEYTLSGCSASTQPVGSGDDGGDSSSTNPCSLANVVAPTGGALGTICADTNGSLAHGSSCDMTCNDGTTLTNQPQCNNGVLSSNTATCIPDVPEPAPATAPSCIRPTDTTITDVYDFSNAVERLTMGAFNVADITCNTGYGPDANGISATICDGAGQPYNVTGCSDTDGCAGVDCGTGATCTDNPAPQTGYTCSCGPGYTGDNVVDGVTSCRRNIPTNVTFSLSDSHQSCNAHCNSHPDGPKQCFNDTDAAAIVFRDPANHLDILPSECSSWRQRSSPVGTYPYLFSGSTGECYYYPGEQGISYCEDSTIRRRICKCGNQ